MKKVYIIIVCILSFVGFLAVMNNPNKQECKRMVQQEVIQKVIDNIPKETLSKDPAESLMAITLLKSSLGEALCDALINVNVTNYIFFSTFEASLIKPDNVDNEKITGSIIFGNVIISDKSTNDFLSNN